MDRASLPASPIPESPAPRIPRIPGTPMSEAHLLRHRIVAPMLHKPEAEIFRRLRTRVLQRMAARDAQTLGICSANKGEGKSFIALNLAISLALDLNHSVILAEVDFRQPWLHKVLDREVTAGLVDILNGDAEFEEALIDIGYPRLDLLPARTPSAMSSELLSSPAMSSLAHDLRIGDPRRLIIYDLPPVLTSDDCLVFMENVDGYLMVVEEGKIAAGDLEKAIELTGRDKLLGTVLNRSTDTAAKY